jgi:hypothetical protein
MSEPVSEEGIPVDCPELEALFTRLQNSRFRRSFLTAPQETLEQTDYDFEGLPAELVDALAELSPPELRLLADLVPRFRVGPSNCMF